MNTNSEETKTRDRTMVR